MSGWRNGSVDHASVSEFTTMSGVARSSRMRVLPGMCPLSVITTGASSGVTQTL